MIVEVCSCKNLNWWWHASISNIPYSGYLSIKIKVAMYLMGTIAVNDKETQVKGMTFVMFPSDELAQYMGGAREFRELIRWGKCLPVRMSAFHMCLRHSKPTDHVVKAFTFLILSKHDRARTRVHMGKYNCEGAGYEGSFRYGCV